MRVEKALLRREARIRRGRLTTPRMIWRSFSNRNTSGVFDILCIAAIVGFFGGLIWWSR